MTPLKHQENALGKLCQAAIERRLGDISELPKELADCVFNVYREFITCYLDILRQKENRPADWMPAALNIDSELTDQMRHFFSDYQHITRNFYKLNQKMDQLLAMDKDRHPKLYHHKIDEILARFARQFTPENKDEKNG